jgi:NADH-quinone oxidoreductase subunit B
MDRVSPAMLGGRAMGCDGKTVQIPLWIRPIIVDLGCCGASALQVGAPRYGLPGFDGAGYALSPEQSNVLIVAGRISVGFTTALCRLHERMRRPRWVIAYGTCAISGAVLGTLPTDRVIPVDTLVPGCPPHPDALVNVLARIPRRRRG